MNDIYVIDDFYDDPDFVRKFALVQDFNLAGNYPGARTKPFGLDYSSRKKIEERLGKPITKWFEDYSGCYQAVPEGASTWIHADKFNEWAGVCFLHPNPIQPSGTSFYSHSGIFHGQIGFDDPDPRSPEWQEEEYVDNRYNRLVIYRGNLFHQATGYFGSPDDLSSQRLFQVFFFNT